MNSKSNNLAGGTKKTFPIGIDKSILNEDEINKLLKITSEKSLQAIARETELLAGEGGYGSGGEMMRGDMKVSLEEIEDFLKEISPFNAPKVTRKELKSYLMDADVIFIIKEIAFLMNGLYEMDSGQLHELLSSTQIEEFPLIFSNPNNIFIFLYEEFDAVEEAFKLLDVDNKGFLSVDTFKSIFKNLNLGEIAPSDEDIFKEVADFDGDGVINLVDFRKILTYKPENKDEEGQQFNQGGDDEDEDQEALPMQQHQQQRR